MIITNAAEQRRKKAFYRSSAIERKKKMAVKCRDIKSHAKMVPLRCINAHIN